MLHRVTLVRTNVSEENSSSIIRVTRINELRTTLAVTNNRRTFRRNRNSERRLFVTANVVTISFILVTLMMEWLCPPKSRFLENTRRNIPENGFFIDDFDDDDVDVSDNVSQDSWNSRKSDIFVLFRICSGAPSVVNEVYHILLSSSLTVQCC
jgi:hypothetical protein